MAPKLGTIKFYRPEIDGLRAFAVISVILNHFNENFIASGYLGVDIFFVISGYVITASLSNKENINFKSFLIDFYEKRLKRIIPALIFFFLVISILISFFNVYPARSFNTGISSLFGFSNILLYIKSTDYFSSNIKFNAFAHTWSLGVEEQFYFIFPFLFWFSGFKRKINGRRNLIILLISLSIVSLFSFFNIYESDNSAAYFLMPFRFWEIALGSIIFLIPNGFLEKTKNNLLSLICFLLLIIIMFYPNNNGGQLTFLTVILTCLIIKSLEENHFLYRILTLKEFVHIGLISYSLYLWHWGILNISRLTIGITWWTIPFQLIIIYLFSKFSYLYIENKFRKKDFFTKKIKNIFFYIFIIFFTSIATYIAVLKKSYNNIFLGNSALSNTLFDKKNCNIFSKTYESLSLNSSYCGSFFSKETKTIYNIGDSHAYLFSRFVNLYAKDKKINSINVYGDSCLFPDSVKSSYRHKSMYGKDCFSLSGKLEKEILKKINKGDIFMLSLFSIGNKFIYEHKFENFKDVFYDKNNNKITSKQAIEVYFNDLESLFLRLSQKGVKILFYLHGPTFEKSGYGRKCRSSLHNNQWFNLKDQKKKCLLKVKGFDQEVRKPLQPYINKLKTKIPNLIIVDALKGDACSKNYCDGGYYSDANHMDYWYAEKFIKEYFDNL